MGTHLVGFNPARQMGSATRSAASLTSVRFSVGSRAQPFRVRLD
jgi:hypothetical protein